MIHENNDQIDAVKHWLDEIVIGLNFCPFAAKPRRNKQIRYICSQATSSEDLLIDLQEELTLLDQTPATEIETTLLIISKMLADFSDYNQFLDLVDELLVQCEWEGIFQVASFHPDYSFADTEPDSVDNLTNRSPFPVLHIIREDSIEKVIKNITSADEIYKQNIQTIRNLSSEQIKTLFYYLSSTLV